jgi:hypothetical protein
MASTKSAVDDSPGLGRLLAPYEDIQLVPQGKHLEQQVATRRRCQSDRPNDVRVAA